MGGGACSAILLVGTADSRRQEVKAAFADLGDPPIELFESGLGDPSPTNGGPPPDVIVVLFDGGNEERALELPRAANRTGASGRRCSPWCRNDRRC